MSCTSCFFIALKPVAAVDLLTSILRHIHTSLGSLGTCTCKCKYTYLCTTMASVLNVLSSFSYRRLRSAPIPSLSQTQCLSRGDEAEPWIAHCMLFLQMKLNDMAMPHIYAMINYYHGTNDILSEGGPEMVCLTPSDEWYSSQLAASSSLSYCNLIQI